MAKGSCTFKVQPRDVPAVSAAQRIGLSEVEFDGRLPNLIARGFPKPDPEHLQF